MEAVSGMGFEPSSNLAKTLPSALEPGGPVWQAEADGEAQIGSLQGNGVCFEKASVVAHGLTCTVLGQISLWLSQPVKAGIFSCVCPLSITARSMFLMKTCSSVAAGSS